MTLGLVVVAGLAATLGGALAWRNLRPANTPPRPRETLRERLDAPQTLPAAAVNASPSAPPALESKAPPSANGSASGYALELGPFASAKEAEEAEQRVNEAGYATMRVRHAPGASVYVVLIDRIETPKDGDALVQTLRGQGFGDALVVEDGGTSAVRVGTPRPLRDAVSVAERLRALGHPVRVASQPADPERFVVRHGTYSNREAASEKGEALKRLGFTPQIVRVR
jgi:cell division septation protein DedD